MVTLGNTINHALFYRLRHAIRSLTESTDVTMEALNTRVDLKRRNASRLSRQQIEFAVPLRQLDYLIIRNRKHVLALALMPALARLLEEEVTEETLWRGLPDVNNLPDPAPRDRVYEWVTFWGPRLLVSDLIQTAERYGVIASSRDIPSGSMVPIALARPMLLSVGEEGPIWRMREETQVS